MSCFLKSIREPEVYPTGAECYPPENRHLGKIPLMDTSQGTGIIKDVLPREREFLRFLTLMEWGHRMKNAGTPQMGSRECRLQPAGGKIGVLFENGLGQGNGLDKHHACKGLVSPD